MVRRHLAGRLGRFALADRRAHVSDYLSRHRWTGRRAEAPAANVQPTAKGHPMSTGTVKWYNDQKGYGFIAPDQGGKDVFVHASALERAGIRSLRDGQKVSYEIETDQRTGKQSAGSLQTA